MVAPAMVRWQALRLTVPMNGVGDEKRLICTDFEAGHTAGRDARHRELNFFPETKGRLPFYAIGLRPRNDLISKKPDDFARDDIFR